MDRRVQVVVARMESAFLRTPSVTELAASVNLSAGRLRQLFRAELGMTPAQYIKSLRLKKASELLATTFLSIKEVMVSVGFNNKSQFTHDFRKAYGSSPTRYREKCFDQSLEPN